MNCEKSKKYSLRENFRLVVATLVAEQPVKSRCKAKEMVAKRYFGMGPRWIYGVLNDYPSTTITCEHIQVAMVELWKRTQQQGVAQ
jgi:hypothetical protein